MSTGAMIVGPGRVTISKNIKRDKGKACEKSAIGMRDMRNLGQDPGLHPMVEVACFVVSNNESFYSEQATSVCALLDQFSKPQSQRCQSSKDAYGDWKKNPHTNLHVAFFVSLRQGELFR